jgi:serine/threonine-protein kinase
MAAAHAEGIIHRDLKPENIIYDVKTRAVKLLDFGIARDAELDEEERLTRTGFFVGTLNYVAPEALSGALVDEAADTYSLGTIAYYLLTGVHPFPGRTPRELFQQLLTQDPIPLNLAVAGVRFPPPVEAAIMRALSRDPAARHESVEAFAQDLASAVSAAATSQGPAGVPPTDGILGRMKSLLKGRKDTGPGR